MLSEMFRVLQKNSFIKKSVKQTKSKEYKKRYHKKVSYESFSSMYNYSIRCFILELSISISIALLLWR